MVEFAFMLVVGIASIAMGIVTATGNLMFVKWRGKKYVSEANKAAFGKLNGISTIIMGIGIIVLAIIHRIFGETSWLGFVILPFAVVSICIVIYALLKYNRNEI